MNQYGLGIEEQIMLAESIVNNPIGHLTPEEGRALDIRRRQLEARPPKSPFGVSAKSLLILGLETRKSIYRGVKNLEIPLDILNRMNGGEILAKYLGCRILKEGDAHLKNRLSFTELTRALDKVAYPIIGQYVQNFGMRFTIKPGDQQRRLNKADEYSKESLMTSFWKPEIKVSDAVETRNYIHKHLQNKQIELLLQNP